MNQFKPNGDGKITIYRESDGRQYQVEYPPSSHVDLQQIKNELELPDYIDINYSMTATALVSLWAAYNIDTLSRRFESLRKIKGPLSPILMGGMAVKLLSRCANEKGPLNREVNDIDYVIKKGMAGAFANLLERISDIAGSRFHHFITNSDMRFNALRAGERYRLRTIDWGELNEPKVKCVDILVDQVEMRHKVDVRDEFAKFKQNMYTIGLEKLILTKCLMIEEINHSQYQTLKKSGQDFRILNYPHYRENRHIIGMEEKDIIDVLSLLIDYADKSDELAKNISLLLSRDEKALMTFRLNIENIAERRDWLKSKGLTDSQLSRIDESIRSIMQIIPKKEKKWDKPWWNQDVDIPATNQQ